MTNTEIEKLIKTTWEQSPHGHLWFNNRDFEPFHLLSWDYNPHQITKINNDIIEYYFPYQECWYCTGQYGPNKMECYNSPECHFNFRCRDKQSEKSFLKSGWIETRFEANDPRAILMTRAALSFNFYSSYPIIVRTGNWTSLVLHHINCNGWDDRKNNHALTHMPLHTGYHNKRDASKRKLHNAEKKLDQLLNNPRSDKKLIENIIAEIQLERQIFKSITEIDLRTADYAQDLLAYMISKRNGKNN
jgi:hypothetical protein